MDRTAYGPVDWAKLELVVFDVDGTLYDQQRLRRRMIREMLVAAAARYDVSFIQILRAYRQERHREGEHRMADFEERVLQRVIASTNAGRERIDAITTEWMLQRPLPFLKACRFAYLPELFEALRQAGIKIGVFSDYPAAEKMRALDLRGDYFAWAGDPDIGFLKPHPRGLTFLMEKFNAAPEATLMIGDLWDRDGLMAISAGARALIRSRPVPDWQTFERYDDPVFAPLLDGIAR